MFKKKSKAIDSKNNAGAKQQAPTSQNIQAPKKAPIKKPSEPPLNLGQKSIFEMPDIYLLNIQAHFLKKAYLILIILIILIAFATAGLFGYLVLDDQFEWALLLDGTDHICVK